MKITTKERKKYRIRNKLKNNSKLGRLRLSVSRTSKNISAQIIDDSSNTTILSASSNEKSIKSFRLPEPYKGKGIREQGQHVLRKEGKKK